MAMKRALLLGLSATIFGGCYSGVDDAGSSGSDQADRWGKYCYYSYSSNRSATYKASSSSNNDSKNARAGNGFQLTIEADPASQDASEDLLRQLRLDAGLFASHHIEQSCWEADEIADACHQTCEERGLQWNEEAVVCETCEIFPDGTVHCPDGSPALHQALQEPWHGHEPWFFVDEEQQLQVVVFPPHLEHTQQGVVWVADVEVNGFCNCACVPG